MKKFLAGLFSLVMVVSLAGPALAADGFQMEQKNIQTGLDTIAKGAPERSMGTMSTEVAKGTNPAEEMTGLGVGGVKVIREGIHRLGAGAIEILTFWIPKKEPLIAE